MIRAAILTLLAVLLAARPGPDEGAPVELASGDWTRNGVEAEVAVEDGRAVLPMDAAGVRWATVFETGAAQRARLTLHWEGGPDGLLFEVVLDGERLVPARDGWRPTRRPLTSDLGSVWLGQGRHLLEFVAREEREGVVRVGVLEVEALQGHPGGR